MNIGNTIRLLRKAKGINQKNFAKKCSITQTYMSLIENNHQNPNLKLIEKMDRVLGVPIEVILFLSLGSDDVYNPKKRELFKMLKPVLNDLIFRIWKIK